MNVLVRDRRLPQPGTGVGLWYQRFAANQPSWVMAGNLFFGLMLACGVGVALDERIFQGVSVWLKPAKFSLSIAVYFWTLAWFAPLLGDALERWYGKALVWLPVLAAVLEIGYIIFQAAQGQASHFNASSSFHITMYALMGVGAVIILSASLFCGLIIWRRHGLGQPMTLAIVLGLLISFVFTGATAGYLSSHGSHWVGGQLTDAEGLPLLHWSRTGGDLRVAHFFSLHAMQAIPLLAWLLPSNWSLRWAGVVACACAYSAWIWVTFFQAVAGSPLVS